MSPAPLSECKRRINTSDSFKDNFIHKKEEAAAKLAGMFKDPLFTAEAQVDSGQHSHPGERYWWVTHGVTAAKKESGKYLKRFAGIQE